VSLPVGDKNVEDLLLWRHPRRTGLVFGIFTLLYIMLEWSKYSLLTLIANALLAVVAAAFVWNLVASFTGRASGVPIPDVLRHGISDAQAKDMTQQLVNIINRGLVFVRRLLTGNDLVLTVQVALALWIIGKIGSFFTTLGLLYTVVFLAFTLPKVYEMYKHDIDRTASRLQNQGQQLYQKHVDPMVQKIPRASNSTTSAPAKKADYRSTADSGASVAPNGGEPKKLM